MISSWVSKTRLQSQFARMYCQICSTGFSSGERDGRNIRVMFRGTSRRWPLEFVIVYLATLTPYRVLMTWVCSHTQSLLLAIIMHASFTGWLLVLFPLTDSP